MTDLIPMIIVSLLSGLLSTMNVWTVDRSHIRFHLNDLYMILLMTGWMIFLTYLHNYKLTEHVNVGVIAYVLIISTTFYFVRTQFLIDDKQFLKGMIPHHSMAIQMARNIKNKTEDEKIRKLADDIITAQTNEIKLMDEILQSK